MARVSSALASRLVRVAITTFSIALLAVGAIVVTHDRSRSIEPEPTQVRQEDSDLAAYGHPIRPPAGALATGREFITTAVLREDLGRAWQLSARSLKAGLTKSSWLAGTIPVVPYPAQAFRRASFRVVRARQRDILLLVQVEPKKGAATPGGDFFLELVPADHHRWLVSYWAPRGHTGPMPAIP